MQIHLCDLLLFKGQLLSADRDGHIAVGIAREGADKALLPVQRAVEPQLDLMAEKLREVRGALEFPFGPGGASLASPLWWRLNAWCCIYGD